MNDISILEGILGLGAVSFSIVLPLLSQLSDVKTNQKIMKEQNDYLIKQSEGIASRVRDNEIRLRQIKDRLNVPETDIN